MYNLWYLFSPPSDDERYAFDLWTDVPRHVEFEAFGLILGIYITALQKEIHWRRAVVSYRQRATQQRHDEQVYKAFRRLVLLERYSSAAMRTDVELVRAVATQLRMSEVDVERALARAEDAGVADTM